MIGDVLFRIACGAATPLLACAAGFLAAAFPAAWRGWADARALALPALLGSGLFLVWAAALGPPRRFYVWGHELAHAAASLATGRRVYEVGVSRSGRSGYAVVEGRGAVAILAPYVFSFHALPWWGLGYVCAGSVPWGRAAYAFGAAFLFAMTLWFAVEGFALPQPDLVRVGRPFAAASILLGTMAWVPFLLLPATGRSLWELAVGYGGWARAAWRIAGSVSGAW